MKNKLIRGASHNWTHSFMSDMNYVDGAFVYEDIKELARQRQPEKVVVSWIPTRDDELEALSPRARRCVLAYREGLDDFLLRNGVDKSAVEELRTEVYVEGTFRMYVRAFARDNRGKQYIAFVWH
jgi:hypothetical protein